MHRCTPRSRCRGSKSLRRPKFRSSIPPLSTVLPLPRLHSRNERFSAGKLPFSLLLTCTPYSVQIFLDFLPKPSQLQLTNSAATQLAAQLAAQLATQLTAQLTIQLTI